MILDFRAMIISGFTLAGFISCAVLKIQGEGLWNEINLYAFIFIMWIILYKSLESRRQK